MTSQPNPLQPPTEDQAMKFPNIVDIDDARSYVTEANLMEALDKRGLGDMPRVVVRNRAGRFTAIFTHGRVEVIS